MSVSVLSAEVRLAPKELLLRHIIDIILLEYTFLAGLCLDMDAAQLEKVAISVAGVTSDRMSEDGIIG